MSHIVSSAALYQPQFVIIQLKDTVLSKYGLNSASDFPSYLRHTFDDKPSRAGSIADAPSGVIGRTTFLDTIVYVFFEM